MIKAATRLRPAELLQLRHAAILAADAVPEDWILKLVPMEDCYGDPVVVPVASFRNGVDTACELYEQRTGEILREEDAARLLYEAGIYRRGFKIKVEPKNQYKSLYDLT